MMFNRIKSSVKYFRGIRKGMGIPMLYINIDLSKDNTDKNCEVDFHPNIINQLSEDDKLYVEKYLGLVINKIRDNVDFNKR
jgi:hypothetical protein